MTVAMAEQFKEASKCLVCLSYLEKPMRLDCGFICCLRCISSLRKDPSGEGVSCPSCSVVTQKNDIRPHCQLGKVVSQIKELEPQLRTILYQNPRMLKFQVDMTLDIDTANNRLIISDDLRSVRCGHLQQNRRECAERFKQGICVLGSPRFTSGRHYWEVDVGTSKEWDLGVCKESVDRQEPVLLSSESGFWTVGLREEEVFAASTVPPTTLWVSPRLHRVGIFLDMDIGTISFYNISDGSHVFTFTKVPAAEPLHPFFAPANSVKDDQGLLSICPVINPGTARSPVHPEQGK
ncbi:ret finger protein-like 4A isoform X1 [Eulemur rufifrons]|uniref:ret finger protein-like 4A isoform X1 n=2 Tax=Eulemur rufifrons TaxID=859984 RepID=UPI0037420D28